MKLSSSPGWTPRRVNIQDFLQVFQGSRIGKILDNLTSADPLSYTTNGSLEDLVLLSLTETQLHLPEEHIKHKDLS